MPLASTGEKCWIDLEGIESDAQFANVITGAIYEAEVFLFMYSMQHAMIDDYKNDWTIKELNYANALGKQIIFINLDGTLLTNWIKFKYGNRQQQDATSEVSLYKLIEHINIILDYRQNEKTQCIENSISNPDLITPTGDSSIENRTDCITYEANYLSLIHI